MNNLFNFWSILVLVSPNMLRIQWHDVSWAVVLIFYSFFVYIPVTLKFFEFRRIAEFTRSLAFLQLQHDFSLD